MLEELFNLDLTFNCESSKTKKQKKENKTKKTYSLLNAKLFTFIVTVIHNNLESFFKWDIISMHNA